VQKYFGITDEKSYMVLNTRGQNTWTKSFIPGIGEFVGTTIRHEETITICEFLTIRDKESKNIYRPSCFFCYRPIPQAIDSLKRFEQNDFMMPDDVSLLNEEITTGLLLTLIL
jgi:homospermidine synthase